MKGDKIKEKIIKKEISKIKEKKDEERSLTSFSKFSKNKICVMKIQVSWRDRENSSFGFSSDHFDKRKSTKSYKNKQFK